MGRLGAGGPIVISVDSCTTSNNCCVSYTTSAVITRPAALANSVNVFNVMPGMGKLASGVNLACSMMGAGGCSSFKGVVHPFGRKRGTLLRVAVARKCGAFVNHYTRKHRVAGRTVRGVTRNHI